MQVWLCDSFVAIWMAPPQNMMVTGFSLLAAMTWGEITFTTFGGLRGAVSLILAQVVVTEQSPNSDLRNRKVTAQVSSLQDVKTWVHSYRARISF